MVSSTSKWVGGPDSGEVRCAPGVSPFKEIPPVTSSQKKPRRNAAADDGMTALDLARRSGFQEVVRLLEHHLSE